MMKLVDERILAGHQKFSNQTQDWIGLTKFFWQKWTYIAWSILFFLVVLLDALNNYFDFIAILLMVWIAISMPSVILTIENNERVFLKTGELKYDINQNPNLRLFILILVIIVFLLQFLLQIWPTNIIFVLALIAGTNCTYFSACTPKPPTRSRLNKWLTSLFMSLAGEIPVTQPLR